VRCEQSQSLRCSNQPDAHDERCDGADLNCSESRCCGALPHSGRWRVRVRLGHSAISAQCPVCLKADMARRFMSTRRIERRRADASPSEGAMLPLAPPAISERRHPGLARRLIAVCVWMSPLWPLAHIRAAHHRRALGAAAWKVATALSAAKTKAKTARSKVQATDAQNSNKAVSKRRPSLVLVSIFPLPIGRDSDRAAPPLCAS